MSSDEKALMELMQIMGGLPIPQMVYEWVIKTRQEAREEERQLLDTHTVKEEKYCNEENCMAKDDLIPHEHVKEESTTPEKKCCKNCGLDYQDPIYCSIFGRSADKHEWI